MFELGLIGYGEGLMIFHKMSPRTHQYDYLYFVTKSLNPRNNCGTHFCSPSPLFMSKVVNYCQLLLIINTLCRIDHWDHEKERIVLITKNTLCLVKYNFSGLKFDGVRKVPLIECNKIQIGRFVYPKTTMMM